MEKLLCRRCGHEWVRRMEKLPIRCPKCTSQAWQKERKDVNSRKGKGTV